ncbi:hypothetical protein LAZ67_9001984 [Cordylochernes scorpioides]|uniref:Reverse transcriptase domain-containing protein n=1 Tax=Cordylochernes scorpioides TaxID=51811 RepID=A0ABY6KU04_9ARAC|nr:hypothetical protein LAZ67_9001984 [Cordylochernes scorpioides]
MALEAKLGKGCMYQLSKMEGHILVGLSSMQLAERLIEEGLDIEEATLRAFPLRKKAERIAVGNVPFFVTDADLIAALKPFGRVTSIIQQMMELDNSCWADACREAFITLHDGVRLSQIPARLDIKTKGVITPVYVSYGIRCSLCHRQGHKQVNCPQKTGMTEDKLLFPDRPPVARPNAQSKPLASSSQASPAAAPTPAANIPSSIDTAIADPPLSDSNDQATDTKTKSKSTGVTSAPALPKLAARRHGPAMLPKSHGGPGLQAFRPISLPTTDYRVLSGVVMGRLRRHLPNLVPDCQTYAVPGRSSSWTIAQVADSVAWAARHETPLAVISLDLKSAFDILSRIYLFALLEKLGLPSAFLGVVAYADDIVLFIRDDAQFELIPLIFEVFRMASRVAVNFSKSCGLWCGSWRHRTDSPLGISWTSESLNILSSTITAGNTVASHLMGLLERAIARWSPFVRGLSLVGRTRAANCLVLGSILHHLHGYVPAKTTIGQLQERLARFVWGTSRLSWLPGGILARPASEGGVGLLDIAGQLRLACLKGVRASLRGAANGYSWLVRSRTWITSPAPDVWLSPRRRRLLSLWESVSSILELNHRILHPASLRSLRLRGDNRFLRPPDLLAPDCWLQTTVRTSQMVPLLLIFCQRLLQENASSRYHAEYEAETIVLRGSITPITRLNSQSARRALDAARLQAHPAAELAARCDPTVDVPRSISWADLRRNCFSGHDTDVALGLVLHALPDPDHPASRRANCAAYKDIYEPLTKNPLTNLTKDFNRQFNKIKLKYKLDNKTFDSLKATAQNLPNLHGLPKVHKPNTPLRPIVSYSGSPLYPITKFLSSIISPFQKKLLHTVPNPIVAIEAIKNTPVSPGSRIISFDIESLYTSIPHDEAILALQEFINSHPDLPLPIPKEALIELVKICLSFNYFFYKNRYFKQVKGLPMGNPISSALANVFMDKIDKLIVESTQLQILMWKRYIDDVLCITEVDVSIIINFLNSLRPFLKFTYELEENGSLPFLDLQLTRNQNKIETKIYRKPTHTGNYLNFNSFGPICHKVAVVKTLSKRLTTHFTDKTDEKIERARLFQELQSNNYPKEFIKKQLYAPKIPSTNNRQISTPNMFCSLPYSYGCERIARSLKKHNITTRYQPNQNLRSIFRHPDTKQIYKPEDRANVVYKIPCKSCQAIYIGETSKPLSERINQHKSALKRHNPTSLLVDLAFNNSHTPDFDHTSIIHQNIKEKHCRLGMLPATAEQCFLRKACLLDTYGIDPHPVKDQKGNQLYLGMNHCGILTFQGNRKTHHFKWSDIQKINLEGKMFIIHLLFGEKKHLIGFKCPTQAACQHLWRCATEQKFFYTIDKMEGWLEEVKRRIALGRDTIMNLENIRKAKGISFKTQNRIVEASSQYQDLQDGVSSIFLEERDIEIATKNNSAENRMNLKKVDGYVNLSTKNSSDADQAAETIEKNVNWADQVEAAEKDEDTTPFIQSESSTPKPAGKPRVINRNPVAAIKNTRQQQQINKARSATASFYQGCFIEWCSDFDHLCYMRALEEMLGRGSVFQLMRMSGHMLASLKRAEKIIIGNLPIAVKEEDLVAALRPYCRVVSLTFEIVNCEGYSWATGNREAFILMNDGMKLHQLPGKVDIKSKGETTPAFITHSVKCSMCHRQRHRRASCPRRDREERPTHQQTPRQDLAHLPPTTQSPSSAALTVTPPAALGKPQANISAPAASTPIQPTSATSVANSPAGKMSFSSKIAGGKLSGGRIAEENIPSLNPEQAACLTDLTTKMIFFVEDKACHLYNQLTTIRAAANRRIHCT